MLLSKFEYCIRYKFNRLPGKKIYDDAIKKLYSNFFYVTVENTIAFLIFNFSIPPSITTSVFENNNVIHNILYQKIGLDYI